MHFLFFNLGTKLSNMGRNPRLWLISTTTGETISQVKLCEGDAQDTEQASRRANQSSIL